MEPYCSIRELVVTSKTKAEKEVYGKKKEGCRNE